MIALDNTGNAFQYLSNKELKRACRLFTLLSKLGGMNRSGKANSWASIPPVNFLLKNRIFDFFSGGLTLETCERVGDELWGYGVYSSPAPLVECNDKQLVFDEYLRAIRIARDFPNHAFTLVKLSTLVEPRILRLVSQNAMLNHADKGIYTEFANRVRLLCNEAFSSGKSIIIDAEHVDYQPAIDSIASEMMMLHNGDRATVYQTFRFDMVETFERLVEQLRIASKNGYILGAKLLRGTLTHREVGESEKILFQNTQNDINHSLNEAIKFLLNNLASASFIFGTHNHDTILYILSLMENLGVSPGDPQVFFAHHLGLADHLSFNLALSGYNVVKTIPYGPKNIVEKGIVSSIIQHYSASSLREERHFLRKEVKRREKLVEGET